MALQIRATLLRSTGPKRAREVVWVRRYGWMDTAMPRAAQLLMREGQPGDLIEFSGESEGFQLGVMRLVGAYAIQMEWAPLVKQSPSLMRLLGAA